MSLIYGTALLLAAGLLLPVFRLVFARLDATPGEPTFGPTEAVGLVFTLCVSMGLAFVGRAFVDDATPLTYATVAAALVGAIVFAVVVWKLIARLAPTEGGNTLPGKTEDRPNRRGPSGSGRPAAAARRARAA